jgi:hypothetical protein
VKNSDISDRPTASWRRSLALACLRFGSTAAVVSAIAGPALMHYHVDGQRLTRKIVLEAQHSPDDAVLDEVGHMTLITTLPLTASPPTWQPKSPVDACARRLIGWCHCPCRVIRTTIGRDVQRSSC